MGYCLIHESMLDTVLFAHDKCLVEDGVILPDKATMYISAIEDGAAKRDRIDFWNDVYRFDMTLIQEIALCKKVLYSEVTIIC
jgi:type I protein arginine methyltransferase